MIPPIIGKHSRNIVFIQEEVVENAKIRFKYASY